MKNKVINITILVLLAVFILFRVNTALNQMNSDDQQPSQSIEEFPTVFTGVMPCADCPGIESTVLIEEESFTEWSHYQDRGDNLYQVDGNWSFSGDTLKLYRVEGELHKAFLYSKDQLQLLDRDLQSISSELEDQYSLTRSPEEESIRSRHAELRRNGINFLASGNEPFWSVHVNFESDLIYKTPEEEQTFSFSDVTESKEEDQTLYSNETLQLNVSSGYCRDSMSGFLFTHKVTLQINSRELSGCGRYL
ncbi:copper resistance protein NlpE N-terminal domain-containing protein [Rhodohalobacter barkolensis]|uniref:NlpE C-terminal OB domain-containing protein n=1 Tax=Rhodohalobacter barkolensis TaxID=2053187 RepID=A0A2N0VLH9_9BACT|nr:copper resistance protein NlpE N-terminal domain-containing protein [Rhodohalobacter barkolensis]PKD45014.1 hypothetical protein CWD77_06040 [Rhodohalobacter barkolensis]